MMKLYRSVGFMPFHNDDDDNGKGYRNLHREFTVKQ